MSVAAGRGIFPINNQALPAEGGVGITLALDFTNGAIVSSGDFGLEQMSGVIGFVQSVFIDNSLSAKPLTLTINGTGQNITIKAGQQGFFPVIPPQGGFSWIATCGPITAGVKVPVIFMNVFLPPYLWQAV
jgi:hypothetical protein